MKILNLLKTVSLLISMIINYVVNINILNDFIHIK